jgi:hypothetical protein
VSIRNVTAVIIAAILVALSIVYVRRLKQQPARTNRYKLPTFRGDGLKPGVDLDNSAELLDIMEQPDPS